MKKQIATISRTNEILNKYELFAKKNYGQNFLIEPNIVNKIANAAIKNDNTLVIEIGPGIGALTQALAIRASKLIAYEIDTRLLEVLSNELDEFDNITVINKDFLEVDVKSVVDECKAKGYDVVVAANLPYYITTPLLFKLFESKASIDSITVMMQKEVADRFKAEVGSKDYNALSIITNCMCEVKTVTQVPRSVFNPKPNVDSTVLQFKLKSMDNAINRDKLFELIKACFKQRRKTILNNLSDYLKDKQQATQMLTLANIDLSCRAQNLIIDDYLRLYEVINNEVKG